MQKLQTPIWEIKKYFDQYNSTIKNEPKFGLVSIQISLNMLAMPRIFGSDSANRWVGFMVDL